MKKRRHHYVWRYYLGAWSDNEKIWCCRNGEIFNPNLINIGLEKDFYKLKRLSTADIEIIRKIAIEPSQPHLQKVNKRWIDLFEYIFKVKDWIESMGITDEKANELIDIAINNFEEDLHSGIEGDAIQYIDSILDENIEFYQTEKGCIAFSHFISVQFMRTKNVKSSVLEILSLFKIIDLENIWNVLSHIFATNISWHLYANRRSFIMVLFKNETSGELLTGDQPVINTRAASLGFYAPPDKLEFYYPVSPKLAILITDEKINDKGKKRLLSCREVEDYNKMMVEQAHTQIYARSKKCLEKYSTKLGR